MTKSFFFNKKNVGNLATIDMFINELCSRYANMVRQLLIETINPINSNKEGIYINDDDNGGGAGGGNEK